MDMDKEEFSKEADVTLPAISEKDFYKAMLSAPDKCEHCDGDEFVPATIPTLGGGFSLPVCKNCNRVSRPTNWPSSTKEGSKISAATFDSKYVCDNEGCGGSNYKVVGFGEAMKHYVKNFGNSPPVFRCTTCGADATGNDINRFRDMGQELHDQWKAKWKGNNVSEKTAAGQESKQIASNIEEALANLAEYIHMYEGNDYDTKCPECEGTDEDCDVCDGTGEVNPDDVGDIFDTNTIKRLDVNKNSLYNALNAIKSGDFNGGHVGVVRDHLDNLGQYVEEIGPDVNGIPGIEGVTGYGLDELHSMLDGLGNREASVKTALENPFDGYGRPFSEDPLNPNVDPAYYGDNPASDTKPYAGPNSYSINTTAPYMPPNSGMEDPGQNVGPYNPPGYEEEAAELGLQTTAKSYDSWNSETEWFDGTSESIYRRIASAREIQKTADRATANLIEEQVKVLEKVANEFEDSSLAEYMTSVPGGTVAMEYDNLMDGGLVDPASFISTEAHKYITEVNTYDWEKFASDAPRMWVTAKAHNNPGVLSMEHATREAAIDYVKAKTMVLMDPVLRADIIDNFVSDVEVERRSYVAAAETKAEAEAERRAEYERQQRARVAAELSELEYADDDIFPGQTVVGTNDPFDFGDDDGSAMYAEAKKVVEAHANRNWESFCTEGARDWFYSNDSGKNSMYRHADTTRHAAKQYVEEETTLVKDAAMKSEIRRAFLASVDFLREEWLEKQASIEEPEEDIDVLSQYYDDETLW